MSQGMSVGEAVSLSRAESKLLVVLLQGKKGFSYCCVQVFQSYENNAS